MRNDWNKLYLEFPKGNFLVAKATLELELVDESITKSVSHTQFTSL